jgi:hypothetical protein
MDGAGRTDGGLAWRGFGTRPVAAPWLDVATAWTTTGYGLLLMLAVPFVLLDFLRAGSEVDTAYERAVRSGAAFSVEAVDGAKADVRNYAQFNLVYTAAAGVAFTAVGIWLWRSTAVTPRLAAALVAVVAGLTCCCGAGFLGYVSSDGDSTDQLLGYAPHNTLAGDVADVMTAAYVLTPVVSFAICMLVFARQTMRQPDRTL